MKRFAWTAAMLLTLSSVTMTVADEPVQTYGPPPEVVAAWEAGDGDLLPGPPEWVIAMWSEDGDGPNGMPPWVAAMHERAAEIGLPGPPLEVIDAWENGEGKCLPGPPQFVLDIFAMFGSGI